MSPKLFKVFNLRADEFCDCIEVINEYIAGGPHSINGAKIRLDDLEEIWHRLKHVHEQAMTSREQRSNDETYRILFRNYRKMFLNCKVQLLDLITELKDPKISNTNKSYNNNNNNNSENYKVNRWPLFYNVESVKRLPSVDKDGICNDCPAALPIDCNDENNSLLHRDTKKIFIFTNQPSMNTAIPAETSSPDQASDTTSGHHQNQDTAAHLTEAGKNVAMPTLLVAAHIDGENRRALIQQGSQSKKV